MATLSSLEKKVDNLPDELIKRLDDRYLKKVDAENEFVTRREGKVATWIFSFAVLCLTAYATWKNGVK